MSIDELGGRKFLLTLAALGIGTAVQILSPKGVTTEFAALLAGLIASFSAANAFNTFHAPSEGAPAEEAAAQPANDYSVERIEKLESDIKTLAEITSVTAKTSENAAKLAKSALGIQ